MLRHVSSKSAITRIQAIIIVVIVVVAAAGVAGYYYTMPKFGCPSGSRCIAIVSDTGGRGDLAFNDMAFKGGADAEKDFGVKMLALISRTESDYIPNLETAAKDPGVILIVGVGFLLTDALNATARKYPDKNFAIIDGVVPGLPNVMSIVYEEHKSSAIVGAIAALTAAAFNYPRIGLVLGIEIPTLWKFEIGYKWGADWALKWYQNKFGKPAPAIGGTPAKERVLYTYTGTFSDVTKGYEAAKPMFATDAAHDAGVVYNVAGATGLGINQAVQEIATANNLTMGPPFMIGVDSDQDWINPGFILVSAMKRVDTGVHFATQMVMEGKFRDVVAASGGVVTLGIGTTVAGMPIQGVSVSTLDDLDAFIQMGVNAEQLTGKKVLTMPPDQIKAKVTAMRNSVPSWVWDAANELQTDINQNPNLVPLAMTKDAVDQWRATLG
jgi:basic membrane protein A